MLTVDEVKRVVPSNLRTAIDQGFVDVLNHASNDPIVAEEIQNNFVNYTKVLVEGRFKLEDYLNAVTYVSHKLMGKTNKDAYALTFPTRYNNLMAKGTSEKDISSYVAAYHKNKLVNLILQQTMIPLWVLNQHHQQKAVNKLVDLLEANSEKVQCEAADALLRHLAPPEVKEVNLKIGMEESSGLTELRTQMEQLAVKQQEIIGNGYNTKQLAAMPIVDAEYEVVTP